MSPQMTPSLCSLVDCGPSDLCKDEESYHSYQTSSFRRNLQGVADGMLEGQGALWLGLRLEGCGKVVEGSTRVPSELEVAQSAIAITG
jgi:hypothetical protein